MNKQINKKFDVDTLVTSLKNTTGLNLQIDVKHTNQFKNTYSLVEVFPNGYKEKLSANCCSVEELESNLKTARALVERAIEVIKEQGEK
jgi:hypothetical protein